MRTSTKHPASKPKPVVKVAGGLLVFGSLFLLLLGAYNSYQAIRFNQRYRIATAVVTQVKVEDERPVFGPSNRGERRVVGTVAPVTLSIRYPIDQRTVGARLELGPTGLSIVRATRSRFSTTPTIRDRCVSESTRALGAPSWWAWPSPWFSRPSRVSAWAGTSCRAATECSLSTPSLQSQAVPVTSGTST